MTAEEKLNRENTFEYLMQMFGNRMAQQRVLKETIVHNGNPVIVEAARKKLEQCEMEAGEFRDEVWALLTANETATETEVAK